MKDWLRWRLWDMGDVFLGWGNKLQDKTVTERQRPEGKSGYEMNIYVECTEEDSIDIMDEITDVLCRGHFDGKHHICINQVAMGMTKVTDDIYTEYEAMEDK